MCRTHCVLALVVLCVGLSSCELPAASDQKPQFDSQGGSNVENYTTGFIEKVIYDVVSDRVFFLDNFNPHALIFCYNRRTKITESIVPRKYSEKILDIALDPAKKILFWIEDDSIYRLSLNSDYKNSFQGQLFIKIDGLTPRAIAVDNCKGYIYWTATDQRNRTLPPVIEKARLDGSGREIVIKFFNFSMPQLLVVNLRSNKLYWSDGTLRDDHLPTEQKHFSIQSADLNGYHRKTVYRETGEDQPQSLGVAGRTIYWSHLFRPGVWHIEEYASPQSKPLQILNATVQDMTTNDTIQQLFFAIVNCENLSNLKDWMGEVFYTSNDMMEHGVNDIKVSAEYQCKCASYSVCQNYCLQGNCSVTAEGQPKCRCNSGFSGQRCEVNVCQDYCLNDGNCSLNKEDKAVCQCRADYEGERCEVSKCLNRLNKHFQTVAMLRDVLNADIVVGARNELEFYNNGAVSHVEDFGLDLDIEHVAYDVVHNRLLLVDGNLTRDTFIYSFTIATKEILPLVKRRLNGLFHQSMYNLAYDPVTEKLFWTDAFAIYWFSLKPGFVNNDYGTVLFELDDSIAYAIAVDSCKGYVYWSIVRDRGSSTIEKARLDGTETELVLDGNMRAIRHLVIDQQTQKMYWTDDIRKHSPHEKTQFSVNSADLNGENKRTLYIDTEKNQPRALAVSKDSIYWVPSFDLSSKIWQLPKNPTEGTKPTAITVSGWYSHSVAANYNIEDQIQGIQDCDPLRSLLPKNSVNNE